MKKITIAYIFFMLFRASDTFAGEPTIAALSLRYDAVLEKFTVLASFDADGPIFIGSSLISVVLPESAENMPIIVQPISGGSWSDRSQSYDEVGGKDYHAFVTLGAGYLAITADEKVELFSFALSGFTVSPEAVRLWSPTKDAEMTSDGTDYISNFYIPHTGYYIQTETIEDQGSVSATSGLSEYKEKIEIDVYPNPTTDRLNISFWTAQKTSPVNVHLCTVNGVILNTWDVVLSANNETIMEIPVYELEEGTYNIVVKSTHHVALATSSFVKVRKE